MDEFAPKQFGKYYLIEKLAVGGMAEIYKAKTFGVDGFEKLLAIKRILPHCSADKEFITMLIDEAKLSVLLSHANIVQVYDLGKVGDDYFIAMEFISGINLRDVMYRSRESGEKLPPDIAVYIISEMCKGLDYAHRKTDPSGQPLGIVHRDVSPQNVLISYEGEVKIVDFGIAKAAMNISHTMAGILKGKIAYMSPEQAMGKAIDRRTDIFSTGIILHEMLTGQKLYSGESQFEVLKKIRTTKIDAGMLSSDVPQLLRPILAKALAYRPEDRYQNAGDLQVELTKFLYAMYLDFSPRKLSTCITNLFKEEIAKEIGKQGDGTIADQATSSMSLGEQDRQVEFVHREFTPPPTTNSTTARNTKSKWWVGLAAALAVMAVGGFAAFRFLPFFKAEPVAISTPLPAALPPAPTPKIQQEGVLNVISDPSGAAIMVDGKLTGFQTPATIEKLPIGQDLKVTLSKPDYEDFEQSVNLSSKTPQKLSVKLASLIPPPKVPEVAPPKAADEAKEAKRAKEKELAEKKAALKKEQEAKEKLATPKEEAPPQEETPVATGGTGKIKISSSPSGADVFIGGEFRGSTPLTVSTPAGTLSVVVSKEGKSSFKKKVTVTANETLNLGEITLGELYGQVSIVTTPPRASVTFDGQQIPAKTPVTIRKVRTDQQHSLALSLDGFKSWSKGFEMNGTDKDFNILLERE